MKALLKTFLFCLSPYLLISCDSLRNEVDPRRLTKEPEKLVVTCFISPQDTVLIARLTLSRPVLGEVSDSSSVPALDVPDATVTIRNETGQSTTLRYVANYNKLGYGVYRSSTRFIESLNILSGKTYYLSAQTPDGKSISAHCTVPTATVTINSVTLDSVIVNQRFSNGQTLQGKEYYARYSWGDLGGVTNYYRTGGYVELRRPSSGTAVPPPTINPLYFNDGEDNLFGSSNQVNFVLDKNAESTLLTSRRALVTSPVAYSNRPEFLTLRSQFRSVRATIYLLNVDENYYRYHESVTRQIDVGDNPFAEPVPVQTNIEGGLGCFGAYTISTREVRWR